MIRSAGLRKNMGRCSIPEKNEELFGLLCSESLEFCPTSQNLIKPAAVPITVDLSEKSQFETGFEPRG